MKRLTLDLYQKALVLGDQLRKAFPKFFFSAEQEKPLKIGIFHDLLARNSELSPTLDKKILKVFLAIYTASISYRAAIITPNAHRIDLDGNTSQPITDKERYRAKTSVKKIRWALEYEGFEAEYAQIKAKLAEEQSKKVKAVKEKEVAKESHDKPSSISKGANDVSASRKQPVVVVKKRKIVPSNLK